MRELRSLTVVPILLISSLLVLSILLPSQLAVAAPVIAVVGAGIGLPHGAVDHIIPRWLGSPARGSGHLADRSRILTVGLTSLIYALTAAIAFVALLVAPTPTLLFFLVLSAVHFGWGEVTTSAQRAGRDRPAGLREWPIALAYGLVVVGLLLWSQPSQTSPLLDLLSPSLSELAGWTRTPGLVVVGVGVVIALVILATHRRYLDAAELATLAVTFAVAPPLAAFGVYFGTWHSLRHTGRLLDLAQRELAGKRQGMSASSPARWRSAAVHLARSAVIPTLGALLALTGLWLLRDLAPLAAEVSILLALTFPHAATVWAMDRCSPAQKAD